MTYTPDDAMNVGGRPHAPLDPALFIEHAAAIEALETYWCGRTTRGDARVVAENSVQALVNAGLLPARPRVWHADDVVPAGTWTLNGPTRDHDFVTLQRIDQDFVARGGTVRGAPLVEVVLPDYTAEVTRARDAAGRAEYERVRTDLGSPAWELIADADRESWRVQAEVTRAAAEQARSAQVGAPSSNVTEETT